ncbi:hypothetical protein YO5_15695 [Stutzerimonas stutzeri TS44]|nr:hypothetical protein YO5_15695 [Stutzerimonas stutzeri TS44]
MKGAHAYVNDQWHSSGLANLPQGPGAHDITLKFIIARDAQFTGLFEQIGKIALQHLQEAYPGRDVTHASIVGSVVGDGSGDGIRLGYHVAPSPHR